MADDAQQAYPAKNGEVSEARRLTIASSIFCRNGEHYTEEAESAPKDVDSIDGLAKPKVGHHGCHRRAQ
ncbi:MAG: hypothetical protein AAGD43_23615 [Pseudomonadota bacterium]